MGNQPTRGSKKYLCEINILHRERAGPDGGVSPQGALVEPGQHVARRAVICGFYQPHRVGKVYTGFLDRKKVFLFYTGPLIERKHVNFTKVFLFYTDPLIERKYVNFIKVFEPECRYAPVMAANRYQNLTEGRATHHIPIVAWGVA